MLVSICDFTPEKPVDWNTCGPTSSLFVPGAIAIVPAATTAPAVNEMTAVLLVAIPARDAITPTLTVAAVTATFAADASLVAVILPNRTRATMSEPLPSPRRASCLANDFFAR